MRAGSRVFNELAASLEASAEEDVIDQGRQTIGASLQTLRTSQTEVQRIVEERTEALEQQAERQSSYWHKRNSWTSLLPMPMWKDLKTPCKSVKISSSRSPKM